MIGSPHEVQELRANFSQKRQTESTVWTSCHHLMLESMMASPKRPVSANIPLLQTQLGR